MFKNIVFHIFVSIVLNAWSLSIIYVLESKFLSNIAITSDTFLFMLASTASNYGMVWATPIRCTWSDGEKKNQDSKK